MIILTGIGVRWIGWHREQGRICSHLRTKRRYVNYMSTVEGFRCSRSSIIRAVYIQDIYTLGIPY